MDHSLSCDFEYVNFTLSIIAMFIKLYLQPAEFSQIALTFHHLLNLLSHAFSVYMTIINSDRDIVNDFTSRECVALISGELA